jgi:hypothetical protein
MTPDDQVISVSSERRAAASRFSGVSAGPVADACSLLQPVQCDIPNKAIRKLSVTRASGKG